MVLLRIVAPIKALPVIPDFVSAAGGYKHWQQHGFTQLLQQGTL